MPDSNPNGRSTRFCSAALSFVSTLIHAASAQLRCEAPRCSEKHGNARLCNKCSDKCRSKQTTTETALLLSFLIHISKKNKKKHDLCVSINYMLRVAICFPNRMINFDSMCLKIYPFIY